MIPPRIISNPTDTNQVVTNDHFKTHYPARPLTLCAERRKTVRLYKSHITLRRKRVSSQPDSPSLCLENATTPADRHPRVTPSSPMRQKQNPS
jgi:hypothetical protein